MSAEQLTGVPTWATCGAKRLHQIKIPGGVRCVHLFADADDVGQAALELAAETYTSQGYDVRKRTPIGEGIKDFNDLLKAQEA